MLYLFLHVFLLYLFASERSTTFLLWKFLPRVISFGDEGSVMLCELITHGSISSIVMLVFHVFNWFVIVFEVMQGIGA
jgi:hypothetical protein